MGKMLDAVMQMTSQDNAPLVGSVNVYANDRAGGQAAGDAFVERLTEIRIARGNR